MNFITTIKLKKFINIKINYKYLPFKTDKNISNLPYNFTLFKISSPLNYNFNKCSIS